MHRFLQGRGAPEWERLAILRQVAADRPLGRQEAEPLVVRRADAAERLLFTVRDVDVDHQHAILARADLALLVLGHEFAQALPLR